MKPHLNQRSAFINTESTENIVQDEANGRTYLVMANRTLSDGELYRVIRLELLKRKAPLARGERMVISAAAHLGKPSTPAGRK